MLILWSGSAVTRTTGDQWRVSCLMRIRSRGKFYTLTVSSTKMYDILSSMSQESLSAGISRETAWLIISFVASRITTFTISCNFMHLCLSVIHHVHAYQGLKMIEHLRDGRVVIGSAHDGCAPTASEAEVASPVRLDTDAPESPNDPLSQVQVLRHLDSQGLTPFNAMNLT